MNNNKNIDLVYPELSYKIIGILFDVHNELGGGLPEKVYYKAIKLGFEKEGIMCKEQLMIPLEFKGRKIGRCFLDFLVDDKIVLEIKTGNRFTKGNIAQVYNYLKFATLKLGIIANFTKNNMEFMRILNVK